MSLEGRADWPLDPVAPGELLRDLMESSGHITQQELADRIGVSRFSINQLVNGRRAVTAEMALRLAQAFSTTPGFWLNLQQARDLKQAHERLAEELERIDPVRRPLSEEELFLEIDE